MLRTVAYAASCLMLLGCQGPVKVMGTGRVSAMLPPVQDGGPVKGKSLPHDAAPTDAPKIAVVDVDGLLVNTDFTGLGSLGDNPVALFRERLNAIACDGCVCGVVLRINSHGGGVTACDMMWHDLQRFKEQTHLPVVACLLDVGTGGAYYLATAADSILVHPTTVTGGIGVILNLYNLQDAMAQFNVVGVPVKAGKNTDLGSPIKALDDEQRKMLQQMADEFHQRFRRVVEQYRPGVEADLDSNFDGRVFTAEQAVERKLVDDIGYLDDAIEAVKEMSHVGCARVTFYHRPNDPARSQYSISPNVPMQGSFLPISLPGLDRTRLPSFLYLWQPEPTMEKLSGR